MLQFQTALLRRIGRRITPQRSDILGREQGQTILRVVVGIVVVGYLIFHQYPVSLHWNSTPQWLIFATVFIVLSAILAITAWRDRHSPAYRRITANIMDVTAITYLMVNTPEAGASLFVLYLWITMGNGFRFGLGSMGISAALSIAGFTLVVTTTALWNEHKMLAAGVMAALALLPAYSAHLIRQLHKARERAEEASAAKGRFLARMSHELRTPLNGILGTTDILLNNRRLTNEDRDLLGVVQESVSVSLRQIDSVLDFSKLEAGKLVIDVVDFNLHELINTTVRVVSPAVRDNNLRLLVCISPNVPYLLIGDPHHLREIILNLLSNAVKFTASGYVVVKVDVVETHGHNTRLRFEIRDTGIGIAPEALERIWESFSQEESGTTHRYGGTGLGTTIAKQLVELMGGRIDVTSVKGRGTALWFTLPFRLQPVQSDAVPAVPGAKILALITEPRLTEEIRRAFAEIGGNVFFVSSVAEAVTAFNRGVRLGNLWHLVLVDAQVSIGPDGSHRADALTDKITAMQTSVYLLTDGPCDTEQLYHWGYTAPLSLKASTMVLSRIIHASPYYTERRAVPSGVARIEPWAWGPSTQSTPRILVADDNKTNRLILSQILGASGYEVECVSDGDMALDRLLSGNYKAAVLDMHMPGMDGVELLRQYRMLHAGAAIPVIMLTADATFNAKRDSADAGADAFLTKPAKSEILLSTLERVIHDREVRVISNISSFADAERVEDTPVLDLAILAELDRLCRDPEKLADVIKSFGTEGWALISQIARSISARDHSACAEWLHALKGNAANVGAVRLVAACRQAESMGVIAFRREGPNLLQNIHAQFDAALLALQELIPPASVPGQTGPV